MRGEQHNLQDQFLVVMSKLQVDFDLILLTEVQGSLQRALQGSLNPRRLL